METFGYTVDGAWCRVCFLYGKSNLGGRRRCRDVIFVAITDRKPNLVFSGVKRFVNVDPRQTESTHQKTYSAQPTIAIANQPGDEVVLGYKVMLRRRKSGGGFGG